MIGLIKLSPVWGEPIWLNPQHLTLFSPSCPEIIGMISPNMDAVRGASVIVIGPMAFQVKETPKQIVSALTQLRKLCEKNQADQVISLRKGIDKEDWMGGDDEQDSPV